LNKLTKKQEYRRFSPWVAGEAHPMLYCSRCFFVWQPWKESIW